MNPGNLDFPGFELEYEGNLPREETLRRLPDFDALITRSRTKVDKELIDAAGPRLKVIGRGGVGVDNIDLDYASLRGLLVLNAPESNNVSAAELAIMHLMAAARGLTRSDAKTRAGRLGPQVSGPGTQGPHAWASSGWGASAAWWPTGRRASHERGRLRSLRAREQVRAPRRQAGRHARRAAARRWTP